LSRRAEAYHQKILAGGNANNDEVASIHDRIVFKQEGLNERIQYDDYARKSLIDHFYAHDAQVDEVAAGTAHEFGRFAYSAYEAKVRRSPDRAQAQMVCDGEIDGCQIRLTKGVTLFADQSQLEIGYLLEGVPSDRTLHFGVEFNLAGMPSGADDRYFSRGDERLGQLGTHLSLDHVHDLSITDEWLGLSVHFNSSEQAHYWTFPVESVSQSEGGFELVHQSVAVVPHWHIRGDAEGRWSVVLKMDIDTQLAESRMPAAAATV